jgi:hypothetical protein
LAQEVRLVEEVVLAVFLILYQLVLFLVVVVVMAVTQAVVGIQVKAEAMAVPVAHTVGVGAVGLVDIVGMEEMVVSTKVAYQHQVLAVGALVVDHRG